MTLHEGSQVVYVGDDPAIGVGTIGKILSHSGVATSHVQWGSGDRSSEIDIISHEELIPQRSSRQAAETHVSAGFEDSLDQAGIVSFAVRETYDNFGEEGVLNALSETGHLATLSDLEGDVLGTIGSRLRSDPAFSLVLAQLDDHEADSLMIRVAVSFLRSDEED